MKYRVIIHAGLSDTVEGKSDVQVALKKGKTCITAFITPNLGKNQGEKNILSFIPNF